MSILPLLISFLKQHRIIVIFKLLSRQLLPLVFQIGLAMILIMKYLISLDLHKLNQLKLAMIVLVQYNYSTWMDWIDWNVWKSDTIHLLRKRMIVEMMNRNHSTYWIVNHWNSFKSVIVVSVILEANLNWRIYLNYDPFILVPLSICRGISFAVRLWSKVLNWWGLLEILDLPNLQSITLGCWSFNNSLSTIIESIEWMRMKWFE